MAHMCTACRFLCQGTISSVPLRETTVRKVLGVSRLFPAPVAPSVVANARPKNHFGVVTMQYGGLHSCLGFLGGVFPRPGHCNSFLEAVIMASNAHQPGGKVRALRSSSSETMSNLAEVWHEWSGAAVSDAGGTWCRVEEQIVVKRVQCAKVADGFQTHQTAPAPGMSDRRPQRAAYAVSRLCGKGFGPPVTEVDWY